jgi:Tfp pilus assembly ATPase PilU
MLTLGDGAFLVSPWKPFLLLIPFFPWAWLVSRRLDKHAARFLLPRESWGLGHLIAGTLAVLVALIIPLKGDGAIFVGMGVMLVIFAADIAAFAIVTNKDDRVPEKHRINIANLFSGGEVEKKAKGPQIKSGTSSLVMRASDKTVFAVPPADAPEYQLRIAAENVFTRALAARASQVDFTPGPKDGIYMVSVLVDGVRAPLALTDPTPNKDGTPPPPPGIMSAADAVRVMNVWRGAAKMDVADMRKKQTADAVVEKADKKTRVRVSSIGATQGMRTTLLIEPEAAVRRKPEALGLLEPQMAELKKIVEDSKGVVLLTAPLDNGRTTTFYSLVKMHDAYTRNVQTLEIDQQDVLDGVRQTVFEMKAEGAEFSTTARTILRRDPDVLAIAELPDAVTAKEVAKSEGERVRVYLSFRADSALQAIQIYVKQVGDPELASKNLSGVICQRVLRKLCGNCRVAYQPNADMLKKLALPADKIKQFFKKGGQVLIKNKPEVCPACNGVGYVGLEGVFEIFSIGDAERALIKGGDLMALRAEWRKRGLPTMQQAALRKVMDGSTSVEEMIRVTTEEKPEAPAAPAPAAAIKK